MSNDKLILAGILVFSLILVAGLPGRSASGDRKYRVKNISQPASLQSLIDPRIKDSQPIWLGGDVATSIKISKSRYVWLFGDTLIGKLKGKIRDYSVFIHNTVGVMRRTKDGQFARIEKYYRAGGGNMEAIFRSSGKVFYWPLVGTKLDSSLLVATSKVSTGQSGSFNILGTTLFKVSNPKEAPNEWIYTKDYLEKKDNIVWGTALLTKGDWLYIFGKKGNGLDARTVLARITTEAAEERNWSKIQNFSNGSWGSDQKPSPVEGLPGTSETTVRQNSFLDWHSVQIPPFSYKAHLYTSEKITGPWRDQGPIYEIPSPWSTEKTENGKHVFIAYAAKTHPELAESDRELVLTYNTNLNPFAEGLTDEMNDYIGKAKYEDLYVPQFIAIELSKRK